MHFVFKNPWPLKGKNKRTPNPKRVRVNKKDKRLIN